MPKKIIVLSTKNKNAIKTFSKHLKANGISNPDTLRVYESACKKIFDIANKDWNKLNKNDIDIVFSSDRMSPRTKEIYKPKLVKFLEYNNRTVLSKYVRTLFNFDVLKKPTKTDDDVLSKEEINKLIDSAKSLRDKAIVEIFLTTGGRRKEINLLKVKDIEPTESIIWVTINYPKGERKPRRIPIVANKDIVSSMYPENLVNYYNTHMFKSEPEKPLFYSNYSSRYGEALNRNYITDVIRRVVKSSGINKKITPHILRHTGATYDGHFLTEKQLRMKYGWRAKSDMPNIYCHMTENQLGEHLVKLSGATDEQIRKDSICPKCKQEVNINDKLCRHCNYILDRKLQQEEIERLTKEKEKFSKLENEFHKINIEHNIKMERLNKKLISANKKHNIYKNKFKEHDTKLKNLEDNIHKLFNPNNQDFSNRFHEQANKILNDTPGLKQRIKQKDLDKAVDNAIEILKRDKSNPTIVLKNKFMEKPIDNDLIKAVKTIINDPRYIPPKKNAVNEKTMGIFSFTPSKKTHRKNNNKLRDKTGKNKKSKTLKPLPHSK